MKAIPNRKEIELFSVRATRDVVARKVKSLSYTALLRDDAVHMRG